MVGWLDGCATESNAGMAANAIRVGSLERAARMAAFTTNGHMSAVQVEPGTEMIERFLREQAGRDQDECQSKPARKRNSATDKSLLNGRIPGHLIVLTSRKESAEWQRPQS